MLIISQAWREGVQADQAVFGPPGPSRMCLSGRSVILNEPRWSSSQMRSTSKGVAKFGPIKHPPHCTTLAPHPFSDSHSPPHSPQSAEWLPQKWINLLRTTSWLHFTWPLPTVSRTLAAEAENQQRFVCCWSGRYLDSCITQEVTSKPFSGMLGFFSLENSENVI